MWSEYEWIVLKGTSGAYLGGVLRVLEHPPQSLAQTLKVTASGPPQSTETGPSHERPLSLRNVQLYQQNKASF